MNNWDQFQSTPKLLPPTVFEKTNITSTNNNTNNESNFNNSSKSILGCNEHDNYNNNSNNNNRNSESQFSEFSTELEKLKLEIKKLRSENELLRHKNRDFIEQAQLFTEASGHRQISITALEEIIHKQNREIQSLKSELATEKEKHSLQLKEFDLSSAQRLNDALTRLNECEQDKRKQTESNEKKLEKLAQTYEIQLKSVKEEKEILSTEVASLDQQVKQLKEENLKLKDDNSKCTNELNSLKSYVNDSMPTIETVKEMLKEKKLLEDKIAKLNQRSEGLVKENSALQTRFKSISEILNIQENQLEHSTSTLNLANEKKRLGLLNKWRTKVFELMIQIKSIEISNKQEKNMSEKTLLEYIEKIDEMSSKNKILENVIEDKKAEICVLNNDNSRLAEQLNSLRDSHESLEKKCQQDLQSSIELKNFVSALIKKYDAIETSFKVANKKLNHLDQRVEFAKNRLGVIKALYSTKKEADSDEVKRGNVLDMTSYLSSIHGSIQNHNESNFNQHPVSLEHKQTKLDKDDEILLRQELEKVSEERDLLANKLKSEMDVIDEKVIKMKTDYEVEIKHLTSQISELHELNDEKDLKINKLSEELDVKEALNDELNKKLDEMQKQHLDLRNQMTLEFDKQLKLRELEFAAKIQELDEKLNEARREQSKAVVIMRQMERSTNREKERLENLLKSCDAYYKTHLEKLQLKLVSLEKERNSLISNLRQHGNLISMTSLDTSEPFGSNKALETSTMADNLLSLDKNNLYYNNYNSNNNSNNSQNNNVEVTSFWLDSKQSIEEPLGQDDMNESDLNKNSEILNQIRKIMGNLELSDVDLDNTELKNNDYETEHVIDDENMFR